MAFVGANISFILLFQYKLRYLKLYYIPGQAISKALAYIFIKKSNNAMHYITMIFWYSGFGMTLLTVFIGCTVLILDGAGQSTIKTTL